MQLLCSFGGGSSGRLPKCNPILALLYLVVAALFFGISFEIDNENLECFYTSVVGGEGGTF